MVEFLCRVRRRIAVPLYEYACQDCKERFSQILTLREYGEGNVKCPKCGSTHVEQVPAQFYTVTSRKS
jgi:putative FmdB family regulatory protein